MSKPPKSSLFMFTPLAKYAGFYQQLLRGTGDYEQLGNRLIQLGEQAHSLRQFDRVKEIGLVLSNVPIKDYKAIGYYFLAVAANSMGNGDQEEARKLFELAVDAAPASYKVKSILSLGALALNRKDFDSAFYFYQQTIRTGGLSSASLEAIRGISLLKSIEGYHKSAIADVEGILPLVRFAPLKLRLDCLNSYAVELSEIGRLDEAERISSLVIASPLARYYPEWQETMSDVRSKRKRRSVITISRPRIEEKYEAESEARENALQTARIQAVIDFMNTNLHRRIPLLQLAEIANLSSSHLSRLFNLETGLSPGEYLIRLRMEKARHLLTTSFLSIKQVMATVGCDAGSRSNFVRQFKRYFDLGPSEYRKLLRMPVRKRDDSLGRAQRRVVLDMREWKEKMTKEDERPPRQTASEETQARLKELEKLPTRAKILRIMEVMGDERVGDDLLLRALIILEGLER